MESTVYHDKTKSLEVIEEDKEQFVTFIIGEERFGVDILKVRDIIDMPEITKVPKSPPFIKGVINLRGAIVPVADMRLKFNFEEIGYNEFTVIIVVEVKDKFIGMIVDSVSDVADIEVSEIHDSPHFRSNVSDDFIKGVGMLGEELIVILDVDRILLETSGNKKE